MAYQSRRDKHRTAAREFRVVNTTAAHDFVLEVPGELRLFVLLPPFLNAAGQTNIPPTAHRDVQRRTGATGICQRICKAHVFDETLGVNSAFNAEVFVAAPHPVAMEFDLFGERRSGHWVKAAGSARGNFWLDSALENRTIEGLNRFSFSSANKHSLLLQSPLGPWSARSCRQ